MFKFTVYKEPEYENDSYLFDVKEFSFDVKDYMSKTTDEYLKLKYDKFESKNFSKDGFKKFTEDRPSLREIDNIVSFEGSIYTHTVEERNHCDYELLMKDIKEMLDNNPASRRVVLRFMDNFYGYKNSENKSLIKTLDTTCLAFIHYRERDVKIVFRASDIKNELFYDFILLYQFFLVPVYGNKKIDIQIYATTSQYVSMLYKTLEQIVFLDGENNE